MTTFPRSTSLLVARTSLAVLLLGFSFFIVWTAGDLLGQPPAQKKPRVEEEEEAPKTKPPKTKIIKVDEGEDQAPKEKTAPNRPSIPAESGDLAKLADQAVQPAVKALFLSLVVPYDRVLFLRSSITVNGERRQREEKIQPTPFFLDKDPGRFRHERIRFIPYTLDWKPDKAISVLPERLESVTPYEKIAQEKVRDFLKDSTPTESSDTAPALTRYDKLVAAKQALSAVLEWHRSACQTGQREGKDWETVEAALRKQLLEDVLLKQMEMFTQEQDWPRVRELAHRLATTYTKPEERESIFRPIAGMIQSALHSATGSEQQRDEALKHLRELERDFPDSSSFRPLAKELERQATLYVEEAKRLADAKQIDRARIYLLKAQNAWPRLQDLAKLQRELNLEHPILRVGVRGPLPKYFSPALACTESERRAVEMLFESLVKLVPDGAGGYRYGRGLSETYPRVVPLGRYFKLPIKAYWSNGKPLTSTDIATSLELLQAGKGVGRSRVWGDLLADAESKKSLFQVTLQMRQGFLNPLDLMTFKIVPTDQRVNDETFATNPVTSGPFRLDTERQSDEKNIPCKFFLANSDYRLRPMKKDTPHIQEIRFYRYQNAVEDLCTGRLDLVLDLTAQEVSELRKRQNAGRARVKVPLPSRTASNRRIYFLAINTHQLTSANLRRALSCAIDRETLLKTHFRGPLETKVHKALNGPFPVGSWACKRDKNDAAHKSGPKLYDPDRAGVLKQDPAVQAAAKAGSMKLKYPDGDPALDKAVQEMCDRIKELTGVTLEPARCSPYQLREDVEITKKYEVAYYHYDYPDESYWLAPLFGPSPGASDDQNIFLYQNLDLSKLLAGPKSYRNFTEVQKHQWQTQALLNRELPFIPLWQLDPLLAYRDEVKPAALDPLLVFDNIEEWHLLPK